MVQFKLISSLLLSLCILVPLTRATHDTQVHYCDRRVALFALALCSTEHILHHKKDPSYKKADYNVKVQGVEISPYPVERGLPATFSISASSVEPISGGKLTIDVSYFGVHLHNEVHDLCQETSCPVSTGDFVISHSQVLPGFTPPGSYTLKMRMEDGNKHQLTCIGFDFSIGIGSSVADS